MMNVGLSSGWVTHSNADSNNSKGLVSLTLASTQ